jgi:hypothetical protein
MTVYTEVTPTQPIRNAHITPPEPTLTKVEVEVNNMPSHETKTEQDSPRLDMKPKLRPRRGRFPSRMRTSSSCNVRSLSTGKDPSVPGSARIALSSTVPPDIMSETTCWNGGKREQAEQAYELIGEIKETQGELVIGS